ncbi:hypothetical protein A3D14_02400 [Candidatus Saccharibacteria bacterium RIFCSPHIGHO2_02_FULL_47_12]|nr:MAG: hypothetical protein A3D14_02400 [Candidatus Saccharibacteria bacterium RIFCSPHIGHO2_02_FULL_47_12]
MSAENEDPFPVDLSGRIFKPVKIKRGQDMRTIEQHRHNMDSLGFMSNSVAISAAVEDYRQRVRDKVQTAVESDQKVSELRPGSSQLSDEQIEIPAYVYREAGFHPLRSHVRLIPIQSATPHHQEAS